MHEWWEWLIVIGAIYGGLVGLMLVGARVAIRGMLYWVRAKGARDRHLGRVVRSMVEYFNEDDGKELEG